MKKTIANACAKVVWHSGHPGNVRAAVNVKDNHRPHGRLTGSLAALLLFIASVYYNVEKNSCLSKRLTVLADWRLPLQQRKGIPAWLTDYMQMARSVNRSVG